MIKVCVLYPNKPGAKFDMDYYLGKHIPMVRHLLSPSLRNVTVEHGVMGAALGSQPTYSVICELHFDSTEDFVEAFAPVASEVQSDIANYTDVEPVIQINEVKLG